MEYHFHGCTLRLVIGDITVQDVDALVNAANKTLLGGGGVDGAIHRAAGPELLEECKLVRRELLNGEFLETSRAILTQAYNLKAKYVIHVVGPICTVEENPAPLLESAYRNCLQLGKDNGVQSIAFPSISTGAFGCDINWASKIALTAIVEFIEENPLREIRVVLFSQQDYDIYSRTLSEILDKKQK